MTILQETEYSLVWRYNTEPSWVFKRQHEFMTRNEYYFLTAMFKTGFVPMCEMADRDLLKIQYYPQESVTDPEVFLSFIDPVLDALKSEGIRHGDLTEFAVRVYENRPYIIDFAESRFWNDPRPDKRPEGDTYWLTKSMRKLAGLDQQELAEEYSK